MQEFTTIREGYHFGYRLYCCEERLYAPVVLIGGAFQSMQALHRFAQALAGRSAVLVVEPPGSGDSAPLPEAYGADFLSECVHQALREAGLERVNLVGISFGSAIAYRLAQLHPDAVEGLVLLGTMSELDDRIVRGLDACRSALAQGDRASFVETTVQVLLNRAQRAAIENFPLVKRILRATAQRMSDLAVQHFITNARRLMIHRRLDTSDVPAVRTLVLTGEHDHVTSPDHCRRVAASLPDASFALVDGADHLMPLERPEVCIGLVDLFLRRIRLLSARACTTVEHFGAGAPTRQAA